MREQTVKMNHATLNAALNAARLARGWTWADLGRAVGLSPPTRQKIAKGEAVSIRTVKRVARVLRISVRSLLGIEAGAKAQAGGDQRPPGGTVDGFEGRDATARRDALP